MTDRRTKIVCTLGPATALPRVIRPGQAGCTSCVRVHEL